MSDISGVKKLISLILSDEKLMNSKSLNSRIYHDEPILTTANRLYGYIPPEITKMKKIAAGYSSFSQSNEYIFYQQLKLMEDYEDDLPYEGEFNRYFPTYQSMTLQQLRGYFTWRTGVRKGIINKAPLSFAFVYVYELLHGIGSKSPGEGFEALKRFRLEYGKTEGQLDRYISSWMNDYVIYYNLDKDLISESDDLKFDNSLLVLLNYREYDNKAVFSAVKSLSSYNIDNSRFYKEYPDDMKKVICGVFIALSEYFAKNRKNSFCGKLFGRKISCSYYMFGSAVFYDIKKYKEYEYIISDIHKYRCVNGFWTCEKYFGNREKSSELGSILKLTDCFMRQEYSFKYPLKYDKGTKTVTGIINKEIKKFIENKRTSTVTEIIIDVSKLGNIRKAADITRDRLITEEETGNYNPTTFIDEMPENITSGTDIEEDNEKPDVSEAVSVDTGLDGIQYKFLQCLLYNKNYDTLINENHIMLSVLADEINEKLFVLFGDTVIEFDGNLPVLIEDYTEELKGLINEYS